jgi:hypothetical protein
MFPSHDASLHHLHRLAAEARAALQALSLPCLLLAAVPAAGLMACTALPHLVRGTNPASADVLLALITLPLWSSLLLGFAAPLLSGRLDRWIGSRMLQWLLLVGAVTAVCALSCRGAIVLEGAVATLPYVLPPLAMAAGLVLALPRPLPAVALP